LDDEPEYEKDGVPVDESVPVMVPVSLCDGVGELVSDAVAEYESVGLDVSDCEAL
jgi:hypothetical protein